MPALPSSQGLPLGKPIPQPTDRWDVTTTGNRNCERTVRILYARWRDVIPSIGASFPGDDDVKFDRATVQQLEANGKMCDVTLYYKQTDNSTSTDSPNQSAPPTVYDESNSSVEVPIQQADQWSTKANLSQYWDEASQRLNNSAPAGLQGASSFIRGSFQVVRKEYSGSKFPPVKDIVGKRKTPGSDYGDAKYWLVMSGRRGREGRWFTRELLFQYSASEWPTSVYANAS